jgi:tetratricopeptide (TPR) repeat protein
MGRSRPLDHPELLAVQKLLDDRDLAEAQRQLARLGTREELAHGITFLTTRLLHARGRLDFRGVAERLRELLTIAPGFEEALALLAQAEAQVSSAGPPPSQPGGRKRSPATPVVPPSQREPASRRVPQTPRVPQSDRSGGRGTVPSSRPRPPSNAASNRGVEATRPTSRPANKKRVKGGRVFTPVTGFEATESPVAPEPAAAPDTPASIPDIPRAPALPQFRDNSAPPSYAPERANTEPDLFRGKSLLPRNAGRYSETPSSMDVVETNRRRRSKAAPAAPLAPSVPAAQRQRRETLPRAAERIRSASPPSTSADVPTLFEIASWIDEGRFRDAVAAINRAGPTAGPEYSVLRARALAGAGYVEQALDLLEQLDKKPSPDAELRAATARLFVELGDPNRALSIATQALEAEPDRPLIRLTYALAAVRSCRRQRDITLLDRAERALEKFAAREGPLPALYLALRACIQAGAGDPQRAISTAQRALGLDPKSPDALAAIAEASTRLGRVHDARQACSKLTEIAPSEGEAVTILIAQIGPRISSREIAPASDNAPLWTPVDSRLVAGKRRETLAALESSAQDAIRRISRSVMDDFTAVATIGGSFLTTSPVLSSFAPYDSSLWSVRRVEAVLDLITGRDGGNVLSAPDTGLVILLGSYLGETLRLSQSGRWDGRPADLDSAKVVTPEHTIYPFRLLAARLHHGRRTTFESSVHLGVPKPGTPPWRVHAGNPVAPPTPWAPNPWPPPSQIGAIGRSLSESPIARYCEEFAEGPLDRSTASLIALDTYIDLVAPRGAPIDADAAWTRRVSVLAGGYLGETLRELVGGEWVYGVDAADDALGFRLKLRGTTEALPVAQVLERVIGERSSTLVDYARTMMRRVGRA